MSVEIVRWQFTIDDYKRMRQVGILDEDDRVELLDGEVRSTNPIGPFHASIVNLLVMFLTRQLGDQVIVSSQNPIQLNDYSEPQPDIAVLQPRADYYAAAHLRPDDVPIVIEVSDSSLEYDRTEKLSRYAIAGIPEAWIIDVGKKTIEQHTQPRTNRYHEVRLFEQGEQITSLCIAQLVLPVNAIFRSF